MAGLAPGLEEANNLQSAGFSDSEIEDWKAETRGQLAGAGFSDSEADDYFGIKKPDLKPTEEAFKANLAARQQAEAPAADAAPKTPAVPDLVQPEKPNVKQADSFLEAIEAGFDMSVTGLLKSRPDVVLPEHTPMLYRIASQVSQLAGDIPAMIGGALGGGAIGALGGTATLPVVGTVGLGAAGAAAGAFALPEGMRTALMEHYEKGDIQSFGDFWERASAVAINSLKAGVVGAATAGAGGLVAKTAGKVAAPAIAKTSAQLLAEVTTMTSVGAALDGRVPEPQEFLDAAVLVGGFHAAGAAATKIRRMYGKGGVTPVEIAERGSMDGKLKQEILSDNVQMPGRGEFGITVGEQKPPEVIATVRPLANDHVIRSRPMQEFGTPEVQAVVKDIAEGKAKALPNRWGGAEAEIYDAGNFVVKVPRAAAEGATFNDRTFRSRFYKEALLADAKAAPETFMVRMDNGKTMIVQEKVQVLGDIVNKEVNSQSQAARDAFVNERFGDQLNRLEQKLRDIGISDSDMLSNHGNLGVNSRGELVIIDAGASKFLDTRGGSSPANEASISRKGVLEKIKEGEKRLAHIRSDEFKTPMSFGDKPPMTLAEARIEAEKAVSSGIDRNKKRLQELDTKLESEKSPQITNVILSQQERASVGQRIFKESAAVPDIPERVGHSDAVNTILSKVGEQPDPVKKSITTAEVYTALVDKLDPINQATKALTGAKELPADKNPYILARTSVDYQSKAKHMFENGMLDFTTLENKGGSLKSTLEGVKSVETLEAYMISKRALEKNAQGLKTGFDIDAARKVIEQHGGEYEAAARKVTDFSNGVLDYVQKSGMLTKDQAARMKESNKDYVPFKRIMDAEDVAGGKKGGGKSGSLKEFKGSDRGIQSPIVSIVENTIDLVKMAETNRPKRALVELAKNTPDQQLLKSVPDRMKPIEVKAEEIIRHLENTGAITTIESIRKDLKSRGLKVDNETVLKAFESEQGITQTNAITDMVIFRKQQTDLSPNQFAVFKDGKRQVFETTPQLAEAIKRLDGDTTATNILFKIAHGITTIKKIGITFTPDFIVRNFERDLLTAGTFSKGKGISPFEVVGAMRDLWKKNDTYYEWLKSGGANGAFLELGERYVKQDVYKLQKETNFYSSVRNLVEKPIEVMRVAAELSEQSLRVAEFKKVRKMGGSLTEGGFASREITVDFQRVGAKVSALNSITAFLNVSIQGLDRTARAFKDDPAGFTGKAALYITTPSVLLWWANKDDERVKEIPQWEKDHFWIIATDNWKESTHDEADGLPDYMVRAEGDKVMVNKGSIYRIPKPQELGFVFGTLPERTLEAFFTDNPNAFKDFHKSMVDLVTPAFVPDAVAPAIEQYFNQSFFTGRDIVPHHLKGILPEYQYVEYTSEVAKTLGKLVRPFSQTNQMGSPMVLDNYIRSWSGSLGQYAVQLADKALVASGAAEAKVRPTATLSDTPFIKSFVVRYPQAQSNSVQDFGRSYDENKQVLDTVRYLARQGDFKNMEKELVLNANQDKLIQLDGLKEALSKQSEFIGLVMRNDDMSPDEKRQIIDSTYLMMTEAAKVGNEMMREFKKQVGE